MNLVTKTYGDGAMSESKAEFWTMVLTMVRVIFQDLRKVRVEAETAYGSDTPSVMVGNIVLIAQYMILW